MENPGLQRLRPRAVEESEMKNIFKQLSLYVVVGSMALSACSVVAERPDGVGKSRDHDRYERRDEERRAERRDDRRNDRHDGRYERHDDRRDERHDRRDDRRDDYRAVGNVQINVGGYFGERQRAAVYDYYGQPARPGKCPPGLAKKGNGCQPPGQAKKWSMGRPLPRDVQYRPVEADVRVRLGNRPAGHEFVRVASDILLIAVGSAMVIDAIEDLQR